jgi:hypothetical protein
VESNRWPLPYQGSALPLSYVGLGRAYGGICWGIQAFCGNSWSCATPSFSIVGDRGLQVERGALRMTAKNAAKPSESREERLKNALRANLKRRKQQARQRDQDDTGGEHPAGTSD